MAEQQNITLDDDGLQWRLWILPNFNGNESMAIMKVHHCIGDGLGVMLMISMLQEEPYKPEMFIQTTTTMSWFKNLFIYMIKPLTLTYAFLFFFIWSTDVNCVKPSSVHLEGKKNNAVSKPLDLGKLKAIGKSFDNATINDVVLSLISTSMKEYMRKHDDMESKSINMLIPFSLRALPKRMADHKLWNDFSVLCFTLKLSSTFEEAIAGIKKQTSGMKNSLYPFGTNALTQFIAWFPGIIGQLIMMWVVSKATIVMSNVPGPKNGLHWKTHNIKAIGFIALIPGLGDLAFGISAMSMGDRMYMAF